MSSATHTPRVTVIMRTKNSDWVVHHALAALFSQTYRDFELLVIDSGSTDRTLAILDEYPHRRIEIRPEEYFPGPVLNLGASHARGELLVFQNSDGVPLDDRVLARVVAAFDDPRVEAALARQLPRPEARGWVRREYAASFPDSEDSAPWITLSMPFAAMRRTTWEAHPFYEDAWASEDTEWGLRARRRGARIAYVRDACVMHSHDYTLRQGYGRRFVEGEADAFLHDLSTPLGTTLRRTFSGMARDVVADLRSPHDLVPDVMRRVVDGVGYYRGLRHGLSRRRCGDRDPRLGQSVVLARHESAR